MIVEHVLGSYTAITHVNCCLIVMLV